jgi:hypothetical protein
VFPIDKTINIPVAQNLALVGDGPLTVLSGSTSLVGPMVHVTGTHLQIENMQVAPAWGASIDTGLEIDVDDQPSTAVHCDQCKTTAPQTAFQVNGLDNASIDVRIGAINAARQGGLIVGGAARLGGYQTLGRVDAFMTGMDAYDVKGGGHFLIEDGWHDVGQGPVQFALTGPGVVTHEGGTIYTNADSSMMTRQFTGDISLLGIETDSTLVIDSASNANVMSAGTIQNTGRHLVTLDSQTSHVTELSNFSVVNNDTPTPFANITSSPSWAEHMFALARTEYVVPRAPLSTVATDITLHRVLVGGGNVGILLSPKQVVSTSGNYSIASSVGNGQNANNTCPNGGVSMTGKWSLQGGQDGFYGLKNVDSFLSDRTATSADINGIGFSQLMTDAGQRWIIRPAGDGFFDIVNRASGEALTRDLDGCANLSPATGASTQEWAVQLLGGS